MQRWRTRRPGEDISSADGVGTPVGRRVALGLLGLGALGVVTGTSA